MHEEEVIVGRLAGINSLQAQIEALQRFREQRRRLIETDKGAIEFFEAHGIKLSDYEKGIDTTTTV